MKILCLFDGLINCYPRQDRSRKMNEDNKNNERFSPEIIDIIDITDEKIADISRDVITDPMSPRVSMNPNILGLGVNVIQSVGV